MRLQILHFVAEVGSTASWTRLVGEEVAFGGWGGISQKVHTLPQKSLWQDPEMPVHIGGQLVHSSGGEGCLGESRRGRDWLSGGPVLCLIRIASDYFQPVFLGLVFQKKQESRLLCEISGQLNLKKKFMLPLHRLNRPSLS